MWQGFIDDAPSLTYGPLNKEKYMTLLTEIVVLGVAFLHGCFLVLEMFFWEKPLGLKAFGQTREKAASSKILAANQGLYNGFIAAGLFWGVIQGAAGYDFKVFFLVCVVIAGIYGALTASRKILFIQAIPGIAGLILVLIAG